MDINHELLEGTLTSRAIWQETLYCSLDNIMDIEIPFTVIAWFSFQPGEKPTSTKEGFSDSVEVFQIEIPELFGPAADMAQALLERRSEEIASEILDDIKRERKAA